MTQDYYGTKRITAWSEINYCPHIDMRTADDKVVPWLASQTDVPANDWCIV